MSVLIKMPMPQNCYECRFCETYLGRHLCAAYLNYIADPRSGRLDTCPLEEPKDGCEYWDGESGFCALQRPADSVKRGKWMPHPTEGDYDVCSACGIGTLKRTHGYTNGAFWDAEESYSFCPNCGARMERSEE